jgi:hypothetical protein
MLEADKPEVVRPADDVSCRLEQGSAVMLKAVTRFGDPVELTAGDARAIAAAVLELGERLEPGTAGTAEPGLHLTRRAGRLSPTFSSPRPPGR